MWKEVVVANLKYNHGICVEGLRKIMNNHSEDNLNVGTHEHEARF
jgi:hypothetical protein